MEEKKYTPMNECKDGHLYIIDARNSNLGIYDESKKSFIISRFKICETFLDEEEHWDCGEPYGTAKPLTEIGPVSKKILSNDDLKLDYLRRQEKIIV